MYERSRVYALGEVSDLAELAEKLTQRTWTTCTAFRHEGLYFVNDAGGECGAQEYAVFREERPGAFRKVESFTCSWMRPESFVACVERLRASGGGWLSEEPYALSFDHPTNAPCRACA